MALVQQIQKRMIVSIAQIAKELNLHEGDYVLIEKRDGGIFLKPVEWVDKKEKYFWTEEWQAKIRKSEEDIESGEFQTSGSMDW